MRIGVLALQGDFREHRQVLSRLGVEAPEVRRLADLDGLDGLIIPGGESTTIGKLLALEGMLEPLRARIAQGFPVYGTCAGMILLAREVLGRALLEGEPQPTLGLLDIAVQRNAFGRQVDSFEADLAIPVLGERPFRAVFIRAPRIVRVGPAVEVLATLPDGEPVAVRQDQILATAFHPELTDDPRVHQYFLSLVEAARRAPAR